MASDADYVFQIQLKNDAFARKWVVHIQRHALLRKAEHFALCILRYAHHFTCRLHQVMESDARDPLSIGREECEAH